MYIREYKKKMYIFGMWSCQSWLYVLLVDFFLKEICSLTISDHFTTISHNLAILWLYVNIKPF